MNSQLVQIRDAIGATSDQQLADFIGVSRRSVCSLKEGVGPSKRMQRLLDDAQARAHSAHGGSREYAQNTQLLVARDFPASLSALDSPVPPPTLRSGSYRPRASTLGAAKANTAIGELEERLERALEEILEVRKELRRMKS